MLITYPPGVHAGCSEAGIARGTEGQGPGQDHHDPAVGEGEDDEVPPAAHEEECGSDPGEGVWVCDLGGGGDRVLRYCMKGNV